MGRTKAQGVERRKDEEEGKVQVFNVFSKVNVNSLEEGSWQKSRDQARKTCGRTRHHDSLNCLLCRLQPVQLGLSIASADLHFFSIA